MVPQSPLAAVPEWVQLGSAAAPLAILVGALIAGVIAWRSLIQRTKADRQDQWWKRAQWAMDTAIDQDPRRQLVGLAALDQLAESELIGAEEIDFLAKVAVAIQDFVLDSLNDEAETESADNEGGGSESGPGKATSDQ